MIRVINFKTGEICKGAPSAELAERIAEKKPIRACLVVKDSGKPNEWVIAKDQSDKPSNPNTLVYVAEVV